MPGHPFNEREIFNREVHKVTYEVIARRWRPQDLTKLVGQDHIRTTLTNALKNNRLHHALLFTGPRGTGKTSTARIVAKTLRCPNIKDFAPCNQCQECEDIMAGRSVDVIEIDGASHNGVDAIRELRDAVQFLPSSGTAKVFIIDEVHMLSTSAFNALLKTLEEPPAHVYFIMATTEAHKIPNTILSRCQRYDFRRIPTRVIAAHLQSICEKDQVQFEPEALWLVARQADGSMRDAQSLLDQVINFTNADLKSVAIGESLGLTSRPTLFSLFEGVVSGSVEKTLRSLEQLAGNQTDPKLLLQDFMELLRCSVILKSSNSRSLVDLPDSEQEELLKVTQELKTEDLHLFFDMALKGAQDLARSVDSVMTLEMVTLRMTSAPRLWSQAAQTAQSQPIAQPKVEEPSSQRPTVAPSFQPPDPNAPNAQKFRELVEKVKGMNGLVGAQLENCVLTNLENKQVTLGVASQHKFLFEKLNQPEFKKKVLNYITSFWGPGYLLNLTMVDSTATESSPQKLKEQDMRDEESSLRRAVERHPLVQKVNSEFNTEIQSIKEMKT